MELRYGFHKATLRTALHHIPRRAGGRAPHVIIVVEGPSGAGKTTWCRTHGRSFALLEELPDHSTIPSEPEAQARFWVERNVARWRQVMERERRDSLVVVDTDPFKLHYVWTLWRTGQAPQQEWDLQREASRAGARPGTRTFSDYLRRDSRRICSRWGRARCAAGRSSSTDCSRASTDRHRSLPAERPLSESDILLSMTTRAQAPTDTTREVKLSSNRQVGLPAEFARELGVKPGGKLIATLARLPGFGSVVMLMPEPESHARALQALLAGDAPEGAEAYVRKLRREWRKRG